MIQLLHTDIMAWIEEVCLADEMLIHNQKYDLKPTIEEFC